jgi:hypothetical protein
MGMTLRPISPIPAKGAVPSGGRRLYLVDVLDQLKSVTEKFSIKSIDPLDPSEFDELSDYNLMLDPTYVVDDASASAVNEINLISCYIDQLKVKELFPYMMPYIAMVDPSLCGVSSSTMQSWSVISAGPPGMGDGEYVTEMIFVLDDNAATSSGAMSLAQLSRVRKESPSTTAAHREQVRRKRESRRNDLSDYLSGVSTMRASMINNVSNGNLVTSKVFWNSGDPKISGALIVNYPTESSEVEVAYAQGSDYLHQGSDYLHVIYNSETLEGSAVTLFTDQYHDEHAFELVFNQDAIKRVEISSSGQGSFTSCLDFSLEARILVGVSYTLFSAVDGSKVSFETGFVIQKVVPGFLYPIQAYISSWGVWAFWTLSQDGSTWIDPTSYIIKDNTLVEKVSYVGPNTEYTLRIVNARLTKITNFHIPLDDLLGLPFVVMNPFTWMRDRIVIWDGTNLLTYSIYTQRCVYNDPYNNWLYTPSPMDESIIIDNYYDCYCLNNDGSSRNSGPFSYYYDVVNNMYTPTWTYDSYWVTTQDVERILDEPTIFNPKLSEYPWVL